MVSEFSSSKDEPQMPTGQIARVHPSDLGGLPPGCVGSGGSGAPRRPLLTKMWCVLVVGHSDLIQFKRAEFLVSQACVSKMVRLRPHINVLAVMCLTATFANADTFELTSGGRIEGAWMNASSAPVQRYVIETSAGIRVTLDARDVKKIVRSASISDGEFHKRAAEFPDTAEGQWRLAQWCAKMDLKRQRQAALQRIVALEPNHAEARKALGHHWLEGRWVSPQQHHRDRGMVRRQGRWQYQQEVELAAKKKEEETRAKKWRKTMRRLRSQIDSVKRVEAHAKIISVRDPLAIPALLELLEDENVPRLRRDYIETIGQMRSEAVVRALSRVVMESPLDDAFDEAIRILKKRTTPDLVETFVKHLASNDNMKVNRAAVVLAELQDPSAASPLIDALVTKHWRPHSNGSSPRRTQVEQVQRFTFGGDGVTEFGFRQGSPEDEVIWETRRNEEVLRALCALVGDQGFGFRKDSWRVWHNALLNIRRQERLRRDQ